MLSASWYKLGSLAALQGAISLTWLIYNVYLVDLLASYGFPKSWAVTLLIVENALAMILEPVLGNLSDRAYQWVATKFGFVAIGVILTSGLFMLIPTVVVFKETFVVTQWILPLLMVAWAMAMTVFRSPAISLIGRYAFASELPLAMSFLTLTGGLVGAVRPLAQNFLLGLGAPLAFAIGSLVLLGSAWCLRYFDPPDETKATTAIAVQPTPLYNYGLVISLGLASALGTRCLMETLSKSLKLYWPQIDFSWGLATILFIMAITALSNGILTTKIGNRRTMLIGLSVTIVAMAILATVSQPLLVAIAMLSIAVSFNVLGNGMIPLALGLFPSHRAGLAVGLFFGAFSGGLSIGNGIFNPPVGISLGLGAAIGMGSLLLATICIRQSANNLSSH
jgi:MFS family permease